MFKLFDNPYLGKQLTLDWFAYVYKTLTNTLNLNDTIYNEEKYHISLQHT